MFSKSFDQNSREASAEVQVWTFLPDICERWSLLKPKKSNFNPGESWWVLKFESCFYHLDNSVFYFLPDNLKVKRFDSKKSYFS